MKKIIFILVLVIFLLGSCALEIANVIGPGGGWVFDDTKSYSEKGWRYKQCAQNDFGKYNNYVSTDPDHQIRLIEEALVKCAENSGGWYKFDWELPDTEELRKMLECFSYGLSQFSSGYKYLSVNKKDLNTGVYYQDPFVCESDPTHPKRKLNKVIVNNKLEYVWEEKCASCGGKFECNWVVVIQYLNYSGSAFGVPTIIDPYEGDVRIRPILRF